jgi:ribonuclease P protein component
LSLSLSFERRLHQRHQFVRFFEGAQVFRLGECAVFRVPNPLGHFRLGITLKARGTSVERNRLKRAVREAMRNHAPFLGSYDYNVVIPAVRKIDRSLTLKIGTRLGENFFEVEPKDAVHKTRA